VPRSSAPSDPVLEHLLRDYRSAKLRHHFFTAHDRTAYTLPVDVTLLVRHPPSKHSLSGNTSRCRACRHGVAVWCVDIVVIHPALLFCIEHDYNPPPPLCRWARIMLLASGHQSICLCMTGYASGMAAGPVTVEAVVAAPTAAAVMVPAAQTLWQWAFKRWCPCQQATSSRDQVLTARMPGMRRSLLHSTGRPGMKSGSRSAALHRAVQCHVGYCSLLQSPLRCPYVCLSHFSELTSICSVLLHDVLCCLMWPAPSV
jgi:hypothetical protein